MISKVMDNPSDQRKKIRRMVYRMAPKWLDRESLVQDVWIQCWLAEKEPSLLVVRHRLIDALRKERVRRTLPLNPNIPDTKPTLGDEPLKVSHLMQEAGLTPREQHIIFLHYYEEASYREIAAMIGVSHERVRQIHETCLRKLRGASYR